MPLETSMPCDILHDECSKDARHCVIVGRVERRVLEEALSAYPVGVLWLVDGEYSRGVHLNGLLVVPVESVSDEDFISVMMRFVFRISGVLPGLKVSKSIEYLHSDRYAVLGRQMKGLFLSAASFMPTQRARTVPASFHRQNCVIRNLEKLECSLLPQRVRGKLSGLPAVILGAGPSLDVSLPKLEPFQERCFIFATDSTLGACSKYSIKPDFVINIDPDKPAQKAWPEGLGVERLLLSLQSTEDWFDRGAKQFWMLPMGSLTEHWIESQQFPLGERIAASNAGFTAVVMARFMGCQPLILLGMDMAVDSRGPNKTHSKHITEVDHADDVARTRESVPVKSIPGNYEENVSTIFYPFYRELNAWLEGECVPVINVNDRGALLERALLVHPDVMHDSLEKILQKAPLPKRELHQQLDALGSEVAPGASAEFLSKAIAAARRSLALLEPLEAQPHDAAWEKAVIGALRSVIQDEVVQGVLGGYFMDRLASLAARELPSSKELECLFEQTTSLLRLASRL